MTKTEREKVVERDSYILEKMDRKFIVHGGGGGICYYLAYSHSDGSGRYEPSHVEWFFTMLQWAQRQPWWHELVTSCDGLTVLPCGGRDTVFCSTDLLDYNRFADLLYGFLKNNKGT